MCIVLFTYISFSDKVNCSRDHTILFVAFDLEEKQPKSGCSGNCLCPGGKCGSSFFVNNLTQHLTSTGAGFQGAFILETILNYNNTNHSQIFPDGLKNDLTQAYTEISQNVFRGDFLALIGRTVDDGKLLSAISKTFKKNGKYLSEASFLIDRFTNNYFLMANSLCETCLQGIMVVAFIILDCIFVLMNTTTMIPCRHVS